MIYHRFSQEGEKIHAQLLLSLSSLHLQTIPQKFRLRPHNSRAQLMPSTQPGFSLHSPASKPPCKWWDWDQHTNKKDLGTPRLPSRASRVGWTATLASPHSWASTSRGKRIESRLQLCPRLSRWGSSSSSKCSHTLVQMFKEGPASHRSYGKEEQKDSEQLHVLKCSVHKPPWAVCPVHGRNQSIISVRLQVNEQMLLPSGSLRRYHHLLNTVC